MYVSVAFQTKFSHPLTSPWSPGSLCVSQQSSALPPSLPPASLLPPTLSPTPPPSLPICMHETHSHTAGVGCGERPLPASEQHLDALKTGLIIKAKCPFFFFSAFYTIHILLCQLPLHLCLLPCISLCPHPSVSPLSFQTLALFLPALSQLPAPVLITPENVTRPQASQANTRPGPFPPLSLATKASSERFLVLLGRGGSVCVGVWWVGRCLTEPFVTHLGQIC